MLVELNQTQSEHGDNGEKVAYSAAMRKSLPFSLASAESHGKTASEGPGVLVVRLTICSLGQERVNARPKHVRGAVAIETLSG